MRSTTALISSIVLAILIWQFLSIFHIPIFSQGHDQGHNATYWLYEGDGFYRNGSYDKAIQAYDKAIKINNLSADAFYKEGNALFELGAYDEAIRVYNKALDAYDKIDKISGLNQSELNQTDMAEEATRYVTDKVSEVVVEDIKKKISKKIAKSREKAELKKKVEADAEVSAAEDARLKAEDEARQNPICTCPPGYEVVKGPDSQCGCGKWVYV